MFQPTYFQSSYCICHPWCCENRFSILLQWLHPSRHLCALPLPILQVTHEDTTKLSFLKNTLLTRNENWILCKKQFILTKLDKRKRRNQKCFPLLKIQKKHLLRVNLIFWELGNLIFKSKSTSLNSKSMFNLICISFRITLCCSIFLIIAVTVERFMAVCRPHHYRYITWAVQMSHQLDNSSNSRQSLK